MPIAHPSTLCPILAQVHVGLDSLNPFCPKIISEQQKETKLHAKEYKTGSEGDGKGLDGGTLFRMGRARLAKYGGCVNDHVGYMNMVVAERKEWQGSMADLALGRSVVLCVV
jgi:hypothetical protein